MSYNDVVQAIADAQTDAQTLEDVINGAPDVQVTARLGRQIWTLSTINSKIDYVRTQADAAVVTINDTKTSAVADIGIAKDTAVADIGTAKTGALASISTNQNAANAAIDSAESTALSSISTNQANANAAIDSAESAALTSINSNKDTAVTNINNLSSSSLTAVQKAKDDGIAAINADVTFVDNTKNSATTTINNAASNSQALLDSKVAELDNAISTAQAAGAGANGWTADLIEYNGSTQKKFNDDLTGLIGVNSIKDMLAIVNPTDNMRVFVRSYYAGFTVGGGVFIYHSANTDIYDGGVSFGKWRRRYDTLTPQCFGAIGDFTKRFLSTQFTNVTDAQKWFPHVTNIATDTLDWAGLQALFNYCLANYVNDVNLQGKYYTTKELDYIFGHGAKTKKFSGTLEIHANASMHHVLRIAGSFLRFDSIIVGNPNTFAYRIPYGLYVGGTKDSGATDNTSFGTVQANGFDIASVNVNQNTLFCAFDNVQCGGGRRETVNISNIVDDTTNPTERTKLTLSSITFHSSENINSIEYGYPDPNSYLMIENKPYLVVSIDRTDNTAVIQPKYTGTETSATYAYGSGFHHGGNNAGCIVVGSLACRSGAIGLSEESLYSGEFGSVTLEGNLIGISQGHITDIAMNFNIDRAYFEGNTADYVFSGTQYLDNTSISMQNAMGINPNKVYNLSSPAQGNGGYLPKYATIDFGGRVITNNSNYYDEPGWLSGLYLDLHSQKDVMQFLCNMKPLNVDLRFDKRIVELTGLTEKVLVIKGNGNQDKTNTPTTGNITFTCPTGFTFNDTGLASITYSGFYKNPIFYINVYHRPFSNISIVSIVCDGLKSDLQKNIIDVANSTTVVYDPPSLATATQQSTTVTLTGAKLGDNVSVSFNQPLQGTRLWAEVTAADTVTVYHRNDTGATVDIASGNLKVKIV